MEDFFEILLPVSIIVIFIFLVVHFFVHDPDPNDKKFEALNERVEKLEKKLKKHMRLVND